MQRSLFVLSVLSLVGCGDSYPAFTEDPRSLTVTFEDPSGTCIERGSAPARARIRDALGAVVFDDAAAGAG